MTSEQEARCDALAKRIAELAPDGAWAVPGCACVDPETGNIFRKVDEQSIWWDNDEARQIGWHGDGGWPSLDRAKACGPAWRDIATLSSLLGDEGGVVERIENHYTKQVLAWHAEVLLGSPRSAHNRPEAVLRAAKTYCAACDATEAAKDAHLASGGQMGTPEFRVVKLAIRAQARAFSEMRAAFRQLGEM